MFVVTNQYNMMHSSGLLVLTSHVSALCKGNTVAKILMDVKKLVSSTLYVHLDSTSHLKGQSSPVKNPYHSQLVSSTGGHLVGFNSDVLSFITKFYSAATLHCGHIDVNILLHNVGMRKKQSHRLKPVECVIIDSKLESIDAIRKFVATQYSFHPPTSDHTTTNGTSVDCHKAPIYHLQTLEEGSSESDAKPLVFKKGSVVLGGTFDRLHAGHKVLLSEAVLFADSKMVIGVSDGPLLKGKTLKEIIEPFSHRKEAMENFIRLIAREGLQLHIERIEDPYGPSIVDPDLQAILVSKETEKGGEMVNQKRRQRGLSQLEVHVISDGTLLQDSDSDMLSTPLDETKMSSSGKRFQALGTLLKPVSSANTDITHDDAPGIRPYIIGLTGGIASGKSSVARRLQNMGAQVIDCDKLGHQSYIPGSEAFIKIIQQFGQDIISSSDGTIDRRKLGEIVFSDKSKLEMLNSIVWPEIARLCKEKIKQGLADMNQKTGSSQPPVFVLDAAVLLEAGWNSFTHEVWAVSIPKEEAVRRIVDRNKLSEEEARKRIDSQPSNEWRVQRANVVLSTLWEPAVTQKMVEKAWELLLQRLPEDTHPGEHANDSSRL